VFIFYAHGVVVLFLIYIFYISKKDLEAESSFDGLLEKTFNCREFAETKDYSG
jgi:hypothetical protein